MEIQMIFILVIFKMFNRFHAVMVKMLTSSVVDHGFKPRLRQTKDHEIVFDGSTFNMYH
jgi:hypothetical protein